MRKDVAVGVVVEEVAGRHLHTVALAPRIAEVKAHRLDRRDTVQRTHHVTADAAATAHPHAAASGRIAARIDNAQNILEGEILLVDVVGHADQRQPRIAAEQVDIAARRIVLRITVGSIEFAEDTPPLADVGDDVDRLVALAVVQPREFGLVAELVEDLHVLDHLGRQVLDGRANVVAEELLAVHEDLLDLLALGLNRAVGPDHHAGHLGQQGLGVGIGGYLEGRRIVHHRIALLRGTHGRNLQHHRFDGGGLDLEFQGAQIDARPVDGHRLHQLLVAEEGELHLVAAVGQVVQRKAAVDVGHLLPRRIQSAEAVHLDHRPDDRFARVAVHQHTRHPSRRSGRKGRQGRHQQPTQ